MALTGALVVEGRSLARTRRLGYLPFDSAGGEAVFSASDPAIIPWIATHVTRRRESFPASPQTGVVRLGQPRGEPPRPPLARGQRWPLTRCSIQPNDHKR